MPRNTYTFFVHCILSHLILSDSQVIHFFFTSDNVCLHLHSGRYSIYKCTCIAVIFCAMSLTVLYCWTTIKQSINKSHYRFLLLSCSQLVPLNMWGQVQLYALTRSLHVPPFLHGKLQQSSISCETVKE